MLRYALGAVLLQGRVERLARIDPATHEVTARISVQPHSLPPSA